MNTYTDRQKACIEAADALAAEYNATGVGEKITKKALDAMVLAVDVLRASSFETTPPMTGFSEPDGGAGDARGEAIEEIAKWIDKKADDYACEYGSDDMGSLSFGQGAHADAKRDHHSTLIELAEEIRATSAAAKEPCDVPPAGWACTRNKGHEGPCAASQPAAQADEMDVKISDELHPDTAKLVRRFARSLANKLFGAQRKYGYGAAWANEDWQDECRADLMKHIAKGDPRDVAAYCAFMWHHNWSTASDAPATAAHAWTRNQIIDVIDKHWTGKRPWIHEATEIAKELLAAAPTPVVDSGATDAMDTLVAVLNAIGYTEEFAEAHPGLKVSEGVKLFLAERAAAQGATLRAEVNRYCSVCQCNRWFTPEGDCVVCIGLFSDAWIALAAESTGSTGEPL